MTSIDPELKKIAKEKNWNLSEELTRALINKIHAPEIEKVKELKCQFCGMIGEQETKEDVLLAMRKAREADRALHPQEFSEPTKLTWLWPDEKFICNKCLNVITRGINTAV